MSRKRLRTSSPDPTARVDALPTDVLLLVLRHCSRHEVATSVRRVSRRFRDLAAIFLNYDLRRLLVRYERAAKALADKERAAIKKPSYGAIHSGRNAFAVIHDQLRVAHAVTWRYLFPEGGACFYGGRLLDLFWSYLREAEATPLQLTGNFFCRGEDCARSEKCSLLNACRRFLNHFEKVTEARLLSHPADFGAKVLDLLDCLLDKESSLQVVLDGPCECELLVRASYRVPRSFFTCLQLRRRVGVRGWKDECRFMFLRLRRIVCNSNSNFLQSCRLSERRCRPSVYSGFGTSNGRLFYYGCVNRSAKMADVFTDVHVEVRCPSAVAPFSLYRQRRLWKVRGAVRVRCCRRRRCQLRMDVQCPFSNRNRLPGVFRWVMPWTTPPRVLH